MVRPLSDYPSFLLEISTLRRSRDFPNEADDSQQNAVSAKGDTRRFGLSAFSAGGIVQAVCIEGIGPIETQKRDPARIVRIH
jgi:hypothetical protein